MNNNIKSLINHILMVFDIDVSGISIESIADNSVNVTDEFNNSVLTIGFNTWRYNNRMLGIVFDLKSNTKPKIHGDIISIVNHWSRISGFIDIHYIILTHHNDGLLSIQAFNRKTESLVCKIPNCYIEHKHPITYINFNRIV